MIGLITPAKFNIASQEMMVAWKTTSLLGWQIFGANCASFSEGIRF